MDHFAILYAQSVLLNDFHATTKDGITIIGNFRRKLRFQFIERAKTLFRREYEGESYLDKPRKWDSHNSFGNCACALPKSDESKRFSFRSGIYFEWKDTFEIRKEKKTKSVFYSHCFLIRSVFRVNRLTLHLSHLQTHEKESSEKLISHKVYKVKNLRSFAHDIPATINIFRTIRVSPKLWRHVCSKNRPTSA